MSQELDEASQKLGEADSHLADAIDWFRGNPDKGDARLLHEAIKGYVDAAIGYALRQYKEHGTID